MGTRKKQKVEIYEGYMQKARHLADIYPDLLQQREEYRQAFLDRPVCTWDDAFTILTSAENNDAGRVQTSGTSDHTARIALNIDSVMERENRDIVRAYLAPYQRVSDEIEMFEMGMNRLNGRTLCVARQLFVERKRWDDITNEEGYPLGRSSVQFERNRALETIAAAIADWTERRLYAVYG